MRQGGITPTVGGSRGVRPLPGNAMRKENVKGVADVVKADCKLEDDQVKFKMLSLTKPRTEPRTKTIVEPEAIPAKGNLSLSLRYHQ